MQLGPIKVIIFFEKTDVVEVADWSSKSQSVVDLLL